VVELGSVGHSLHEVDEWIGVAELEELTRAYAAVARRFFAPGAADAS
jgi:hypothetical protein